MSTNGRSLLEIARDGEKCCLRGPSTLKHRADKQKRTIGDGGKTANIANHSPLHLKTPVLIALGYVVQELASSAPCKLTNKILFQKTILLANQRMPMMTPFITNPGETAQRRVSRRVGNTVHELSSLQRECLHQRKASRLSVMHVVPVRNVECETTGYEIIGDDFLVLCPGQCLRQQPLIWGSGVYASISSVCGAAIHRFAGGDVEGTIWCCTHQNRKLESKNTSYCTSTWL